MPVGINPPDHLLPIQGVRLAATHCGLKADKTRNDLVLIRLDELTNVAGVFTRNRFCAAPVTVARDHLQYPVRYLLINSGNANAGTGQQGLQNALKTCQFIADIDGIESTAVLPFSTGVIGQQLAIDKIEKSLPDLMATLKEPESEENWILAARGIMTTDTVAKGVSRQVSIKGKTITITGICKGSGMIKPDMATMLAYVATDALMDQSLLQRWLQESVDVSFNCISVDGDTSTNDACILMATGQSQVKVEQQDVEFEQALKSVFIELAQSIVRDGEGATKFVEIQIDGAHSSEEARQLAYTIAHSPLVKTALFASDANWGRILAAIGRAPVTLDIDRVDLHLGDVCLIRNGLPDSDYSEEKGQEQMSQEDIVISVNLNIGDSSATVWTTDLSFDYVKINAEYRS